YVTEARATADTATSLTETNNWVLSNSYLIQPGARHKYDTLEVDYNGSFSSAHHKVDRNGDRASVTANLTGVGWRIDRTRDQHYPDWSFTDGPDARNLDNYGNLTATMGQSITNDEIYGGTLNVKKLLVGRFPFELKTGLRY